MSTTIYKVEYSSTELQNGKRVDTFTESVSIVAKDALHAIGKAKTKCEKPFSYIDDVTKKRVKITRTNFTAIQVVVLAKAD